MELLATLEEEDEDEEELIDVTPATSPKAKGLLSIDPCLSSHASVLMMKKLPDVGSAEKVVDPRRRRVQQSISLPAISQQRTSVSKDVISPTRKHKLHRRMDYACGKDVQGRKFKSNAQHRRLRKQEELRRRMRRRIMDHGIYPCLASFDKNGNGAINAVELKQGASMEGMQLLLPDLLRIFKAAPKNNEDQVTLQVLEKAVDRAWRNSKNKVATSDKHENIARAAAKREEDKMEQSQIEKHKLLEARFARRQLINTVQTGSKDVPQTVHKYLQKLEQKEEERKMRKAAAKAKRQKDVIKALRQSSLFSVPDPLLLNAVGRECSLRKVKQHEAIAQQGEESSTLVCIIRGHAEVIVGSKRVATVGDGGLLGEGILFLPEGEIPRRTASVVVTGAAGAQVVEFSRADVLGWAERFPIFMSRLRQMESEYETHGNAAFRMNESRTKSKHYRNRNSIEPRSRHNGGRNSILAHGRRPSAQAQQAQAPRITPPAVAA
eukprot:g1824.t1